MPPTSASTPMPLSTAATARGLCRKRGVAHDRRAARGRPRENHAWITAPQRHRRFPRAGAGSACSGSCSMWQRLLKLSKPANQLCCCCCCCCCCCFRRRCCCDRQTRAGSRPYKARARRFAPQHRQLGPCRIGDLTRCCQSVGFQQGVARSQSRIAPSAPPGSTRLPRCRAPAPERYAAPARAIGGAGGGGRRRTPSPPPTLRRRDQPSFAGDPLHCLLQLFKGADLDLAHPFAADVIALA